MIPEQDKNILLEKLSMLEHQQWMAWATKILETENISPETRARWEKYFVPYEDLTWDTQDSDRFFAKKSLEIFTDYFDKNK